MKATNTRTWRMIVTVLPILGALEACGDLEHGNRLLDWAATRPKAIGVPLRNWAGSKFDLLDAMGFVSKRIRAAARTGSGANERSHERSWRVTSVRG